MNFSAMRDYCAVEDNHGGYIVQIDLHHITYSTQTGQLHNQRGSYSMIDTIVESSPFEIVQLGDFLFCFCLVVVVF